MTVENVLGYESAGPSVGQMCLRARLTIVTHVSPWQHWQSPNSIFDNDCWPISGCDSCMRCQCALTGTAAHWHSPGGPAFVCGELECSELFKFVTAICPWTKQGRARERTGRAASDSPSARLPVTVPPGAP